MKFMGHFVLFVYIVSVSIQLIAATRNKPFIHSSQSVFVDRTQRKEKKHLQIPVSAVAGKSIDERDCSNITKMLLYISNVSAT